MNEIYEIILFENGEIKVEQVDNSRELIGDIFWGFKGDESFNLIRCKGKDNIDKYKKKLINYIIKKAKEEYDLAKEKYNKLKTIKASL